MIMSSNNSLDKGVKEARTNDGEGLLPRKHLRLSSAGPIVIKLLQEINGQKKTKNLQSLVILKQKRKVKEDIENQCINTG